MNELSELNEKLISDGVAEYQIKQKEVVKNFIYLCIEIWEILSKYRDEFKPTWLRLRFLKEIRVNDDMARNQIKLYELSKWKMEKDILWTFITNRNKLYMFMTLSDEQKEKLADKHIESTATNTEFREAIVEVKNEWVVMDWAWEVIIDDGKYEDEMWGKIEEVIWWNPMLLDTKKASKTVQESMWFSINTRELVEWVLFIEKTKEVLKSCSLHINVEEKERLKNIYAAKLMELEDIYTKFFN